ncbi:hypothetical protein [Oceanobacillus salinisoli]|uniref:hypothetical protein n=1 Tax=Oceanobacillus salinisoli TaxID=2678611 RepID=UPI0012E0D5CF|nr:hypothetical protein [Oceanobacillus salinisoli]
MENSSESLLSYINKYDPDEELKKLDFKEIEVWIDDEWSELVEVDGVPPGEATSIIIDSNYKWMYNNSKRKKFVFEKLLELNSCNQGDIIEYLKDEINKLERALRSKCAL